ncbi:hypothetical protein GH714_035307 [Hevea brasiliensis]|uniref:Uncharacterized protein n=1 Tax=Hevea brasiliensis TaxID=3981 RepID=A0A6A6L4P2_HEVBR|nr:hypothetical protein GH714_035307 [Hevea brasiliensis]
MFRANATFREIDGVPTDILPSYIYAGIAVGHFSHIFLMDASSATEPEAMVALANLANEKTAIIVTGAPANHSGWVRSDIAGKNELMDSYFERLRKRNHTID